jgi:hypothetical protein
MDRRIPLNTLRAFEAVGRHCRVRPTAVSVAPRKSCT